jgi:small GTP-binding protein
MIDNYDYIIKIILVGDSQVGKSTYFNKLQYKECHVLPTTIGVDFYSMIKNYNNKNIKINIWDTAGEDRYKTIISMYFKEIAGIIIMIDINNPTALNNINRWIDNIEHVSICKHISFKHPILLLGNKNDEKSNIDQDKLNIIIQKKNMIYKEISCKGDTNEYLEEILDLLVVKIMKQSLKNECKGIKYISNIADMNDIKEDKDDKNSKCCFLL